MTQILHTHFQSGAQRYAGSGGIVDSTGRYVRKVVGTTANVRQFRIQKVSVAELRAVVAPSVDTVETIVSVKAIAMDAAHEANLRAFLVGAAAMAVGGGAALVAPSLSAPWLTNVGLIILAIGALVAAGASERYRRG